MRFPSSLLTALLVAAGAACSAREPASPPDAESLRTDSTVALRSSYGGATLDLTVTVSPTRIAPGDTARIRMSLRNPGSAPVTLTLPSTCLFMWDVRDARGQRPEVNGWLCGAAMTTVTLAAGETKETTAAFTGQQINYEPGRGVFYTPLPAGIYYVAGGVAQSTAPQSPWLPVQVTAP